MDLDLLQNYYLRNILLNYTEAAKFVNDIFVQFKLSFNIW